MIVRADDPHSYAEPDRIVIQHLDLDLNIDVEKKILAGDATLTILRKDAAAPLILDTNNLTISAIKIMESKTKWVDLPYTLDKADEILGQKLTINLPKKLPSNIVKISYSASPDAVGLIWNTAEQTVSKRPFLLTNSEPIGGRSWMPCQDTPVVRMSYSAKIHVVQKDLMAVMSANNPTQTNEKGEYSFNMTIPVPSYLVALAVGKLSFKSTGPRTGVYAEPEMVEKAAAEFSETEDMLQAAESLYGKYVWGRYDLLVLPASYPWGGMENPKLTFVTPTIVTGKKDLVDVVAHEIAHSWSGNLVTNASWNDTWINEGFTTYVQYRMIEKLRGTPVRMRDMSLDIAGLKNHLNDKSIPEGDTRLRPDFKGRSPEDSFNDVPYIKGALFLYAVEEKIGKKKFDEFLNLHFQKNKFKSVSTQQVEDELSKIVDKQFVSDWIHQTYLPESIPATPSTMIENVNVLVKNFNDTKTTPTQEQAADLTSKDRCYFLESITPKDPSVEQLKKLDSVFHFSSTKDPEVLTLWYKLSLPKSYGPTFQTAPTFVTSVGRGKYVRPIYDALMKTKKGEQIAKATYEQHKSFYGPTTRSQIEKILYKKK